MTEHEQAVVIDEGEVPLFGVMHGCAGGSERWGLIFCDPFAEEKKCAQRVMVETARSLCAADVTCLRFDYRGCGDSPGMFVDATVEQWLDDISAAVHFAEKNWEVDALGLLGLRLGASLALLTARDLPQVDFAILWEPVISGKRYVEHNIRRSQIKAMMTDSESFDPRRVRESHGARAFDFDGYQVSSEMREQIEGINLLEMDIRPPAASLVVNISSRETPNPNHVQLAENIGGEVRCVRQEPFWNRIGLVDPVPVVQATELWLAELQAWRMQNSAEHDKKPE